MNRSAYKSRQTEEDTKGDVRHLYGGELLWEESTTVSERRRSPKDARVGSKVCNSVCASKPVALLSQTALHKKGPW